MDDLLDIKAKLDQAERPAALATVLRGQGADCPGPGTRRLLEGPDQPGVIGELLASGQDRVLAREPAPGLERMLAGPEGAAMILLERLVPGKLPPWMHFSCQVLRRGGACVLATVASVAGPVPYQVGERFVYDERNHGLLPMDGGFSLELQRGCIRTREAGRPLWERFEVPGGALELLLEPLAAASPAP
jgi:hypothetical protein